jgi:hypothetical protein
VRGLGADVHHVLVHAHGLFLRDRGLLLLAVDQPLYSLITAGV